MNEIKFRAWDDDKNEMIEWEDTFFSDMSAVTNYSSYWSYIDKHLMQYTGLKDVGGKEIYEYDIVQIHSDILVVHKGLHSYDTRDLLVGGMDRQVYGYYLESPCGSWQLNIAVELDKLKVVGNVYENPELIKIF